MTVELYSQDSIFNAGLTSVRAITQLIDPIYDTDVATKYYVDHVIDVLQTDPRFDTSVKPLTAIPVATDEILGGVKIGNDLTITLDGVLSVIPPRMLPLSGGAITGSLSVLSSITLPNNQVINNTTQPFLTSIPYATSAVAGIVKIGEGIRIANDSTISVTQFSGLSSTGGNVYGDVTVFGIISANELRGTLANLQVASETQTGVIRVGANLYIDDESRLNAFAPYTLTPASKSILGGVIVGNGVFVDTSGVISTSSLPLSGGTLTDALTGTKATFTTSISSPALSGTHYGDGSNLAGVIAAGGIATDPTKLPLTGGTLSGPLVGTAATFNTSVSAPAVRGKHYGDGSSLTGIIAAGGIATDSTKLPLTGGTLTGSLTGTTATFINSVSALALSGTHFGDGSKLTGVIASGGTATDSTKLPLAGGTLTGALTGDRGVFTVSLSAPNLSGVHHGDGSNLTGVVKTQYVPPANAVFTSSVSAPSLSGTHYGDGSNLLGVVKTQYVPPANAVFTLSVSSPMLSGTHYGDGSNLLGVVKTQYVPPANAVFTTSVSAPALSGVFYGDGRYLQNVPIYNPPSTATFTTSISSPSVSGTHYGDGSNLTGITIGSYLSSTGGTLSGSLVIRNNLTIQGNIIAAGTSTFVNTTFTTTSALSVVNISPVSGVPAMYIGQSGPGDIASFFDIDRNVEILHVGGINSLRPNVGVHTSTPNKTLTVNGEISASNDIWTGGYFRGDGSLLTGIIPAGGIVDNTKLPLTGGTLTGDLYVNSKSFLNGDVFVGRQNSVSEGGQIALARASDNTGNWNIDVFGTGSAPRLRIHKDLGGEKMTILDNGNIGIGTAIPTYMLDVVGNIRSTSEIVSNSSSGNQFRAIHGSYGVIFRNDGTNFYLLLTNSSDQYGAWNSLRPFAFNVSTGDVNLGHNVTIGGNVGIGTVTPQYKLDVAGDIIASSWLRTRNNTGWFNETHGGGWHMTDSTYIRNYNSKQLRLDNNLIVDSKIGIGTTNPSAKLHVSGGSTYVTSVNNVGTVFTHSHNYATKAYNGNTWYRFFTFQATNQGQTATIVLRNPNGHDSVEIKLSKHTTGSLGSQIGITAEVRRLGAYTYNYNIVRLRIVDEGVNQATHLEFQIGASTTTDFYLGMQGFVNSVGFVIPEMTTVESGSFATKELFISNGLQGNQNHTIWGVSTFTKDLLYVNGSGNVGIGTTTPTYPLDVNGNIIVNDWVRTRNSGGWYNETHGGGWYMNDNTYIRNYGSKHVALSNDLVVTGNIGIGTTAPAAKLNVVGSTILDGVVTIGSGVYTGLGTSTQDCAVEVGAFRTGSGNAYVDLHSVTGTDYETRLLRNGGVNGNLFLVNTGDGNFNIYQQGAGPIIFGTSNIERVRLTSNGNVGIGTTTPDKKLTVNGDIGFSGYIYGDGSKLTGITQGIGSNVPVGGGSDKVFWENDINITSNYTITAGKNAGTFGPITIAAGVVITVPDGSTWSIV